MGRSCTLIVHLPSPGMRIAPARASTTLHMKTWGASAIDQL
jgi:hypothetical protein